jgi:hypothetical protein
MESLLKDGLMLDDDTPFDPMKNIPTTMFGKRVLKESVGEERAMKVLQSMSMAIIPNIGGGSMGTLGSGKYHKLTCSYI